MKLHPVGVCIARDVFPPLLSSASTRFLDGHQGLTRSANKSSSQIRGVSPLLVFGFEAGIIRGWNGKLAW